MTDRRKFFHDRFILFLLTLNIFLVLAVYISVLLKLGGAEDSYIRSYRSSLGLNAITVGNIGDMISFLVFTPAIFIAETLLSLKFYSHSKRVAWINLILCSLLLLITLIVSNALLEIV